MKCKMHKTQTYKKKKTHQKKKLVFKVGAGNMFTKAQPNSLWQGTEEKVTACAAAKFRRFKKVLLYLQWMWLMSGRPREIRWLIPCYFQWRGDQVFCFFVFVMCVCIIWDSFCNEIEEDAHVLWGSRHFQFARGRTRGMPAIYKRAPLYSGGHSARCCLILHCKCVIADCRGLTVNESKPWIGCEFI